MAGLSMGGGETHSITLARPEAFPYFGLLSGGQYSPEEVEKAIQAKFGNAKTADKQIGPKYVKGIFVSCGSKERPDGVRKSGEDLAAAGYNAMSYVSEGTAHEFLTWRRSLYMMAQMLFK